MTSIAELLDSVRAATGPDGELDAALHRALVGDVPTEFMGLGVKLSWDASGKAWCYLPGGMRVSYTPPAVTASIDAALSLVERIAPGGLLDLTLGYEPGAIDKAWPAVTLRFYPDGVKVDGKQWHCSIEAAPTPALAILAALLSALSNEVKP